MQKFLENNKRDEGPEPSPLVQVFKKKPNVPKEDKNIEKMPKLDSNDQEHLTKHWPLSALMSQAIALKKSENQILDFSKNSENFDMLAKERLKNENYPPNPILALIANRSSQLFGFLRPVNPPGFLDLPTILMLQSNILTMLNSTNRQVGYLKYDLNLRNKFIKYKGLN